MFDAIRFDEVKEALLDFLFPPHCPLCGVYVEHQGDWCEECLAKTAQPFFVPLTQKKYGALNGAWAMGRYEGALRDLILAVKYRAQPSAARFLHTVTSAADKKLTLPPIDMATAVPLHETRLQERGFNQVQLIFMPWLEMRHIPLLPLLIRVKDTRRQFMLKSAERFVNISNAFVINAATVDEDEVRGKSILLLDDILTTGSTLTECAKVLKAAGASYVYAVTLTGDDNCGVNFGLGQFS